MKQIKELIDKHCRDKQIDLLPKVGNDEEWKFLPDYNYDYAISNYGRIVSFKLNYLHFLKQKLSNKGYWVVCLSKNQKYKYPKIHRLVAMMFVDGRTDKTTDVDHIDGSRTNNYYKNLRWTTRSENLLNPNTRHKMGKHRVGVASAISKPVLMYDLCGNFIREFRSCRQASFFVLGEETDKVAACCRGERKSCSGYFFKFKDKPKQEQPEKPTIQKGLFD